MNQHPVRIGVIFALLCQLMTWLTLGIPTYFGYGDAGFIAATVLLGLHVILLGVFNHRAPLPPIPSSAGCIFRQHTPLR